VFVRTIAAWRDTSDRELRGKELRERRCINKPVQSLNSAFFVSQAL
jgi:hypothetical protein